MQFPYSFPVYSWQPKSSIKCPLSKGKARASPFVQANLIDLCIWAMPMGKKRKFR